MSLNALGWGAVFFWMGVGLLLVALFVLVETVGQPNRPWPARVRRVVVYLPVVLAAFVLLWPFLLAIAWLQFQREQLLERACRGQIDRSRQELTPAEWQAGSDASILLYRLRQRLSARKQHLIAAACCRRIWHRVVDERSRQAVVLAERYALGQASAADLLAAGLEAQRAADSLSVGGDLELTNAAWSCHDATTGDAATAAFRAAHACFGRRQREARAQCAILREIVGDPFRPLPPRCFPAHVRALAHAIAQGDRSLFPVLADALSELGEDQAAAHCLQETHLPGCHVLDWVLGLE